MEMYLHGLAAQKWPTEFSGACYYFSRGRGSRLIRARRYVSIHKAGKKHGKAGAGAGAGAVEKKNRTVGF